MPSREEIEKALKVLDLQPGASLKDINEAREELLALWDTKRLSRHPRLKAKAARKIPEVHTAYSILVGDLSEKRGRPAEIAEDVGPKLETSTVEPEEEGPEKPPSPQSPSLFEEAFGEQLTRKGRRVPVGALTALAVVGGALAIYLAAPGGSVPTPAGDAGGDLPRSEAGSTMEEMEEYEALEVESEDPPPVDPVESTTDRETDLAEQEERNLSQGRRGAERVEAELRPPESSTGPVLIRDLPEAPAEAAEAEEDSRQLAAEPEVEPESWGIAYQTLLERSTAARRLAGGEFAGMDFLDWKVVREEAPEVWINLLAKSAEDSSEVHCVWSVNLEEGSVTALSHLARELENRAAGR